MSGGGGGKPGQLTTGAMSNSNLSDIVDSHYSAETDLFRIIRRFNERIDFLEKRIEQLETAYMEEKLLGSNPVVK